MMVRAVYYTSMSGMFGNEHSPYSPTQTSKADASQTLTKHLSRPEKTVSIK
jgi:hypothetical protein